MDRHNNSTISSLVALMISAVGGVSYSQNMALGNYADVPALSQPLVESPIGAEDQIEGLPVVRAEQFSINYELDPASIQYISRVELWCGRGRSGSWSLYDYDLDRTPPVDFKVAGEGIWRFLIVPVDVNGVRYYHGSSNVPTSSAVIPAFVPAQTTLFIDYTPPQIYMHDPLIQTTANSGSKIVIQWNVLDNFLGEFPVQLYWIEVGKQQWQPVSQSFKAFDSFSWQIPPYVNNPVCFKLVCKDKAGNIQEKVSNLISLNDGSVSPAINPYNETNYVLNGADSSNGIPAIPDSPLVSTDINSGQNKSLSAQMPPSDSFYPRSVEVAPGTAMPADNSGQNQLPGYYNEDDLQGYGSVQPAVNAYVAEDSSPENGRKVIEKLTGRSADYMQLGFESYERGEYERARMLFEQVIAMQPDYIQAYYHLADVLYLQGKFEQAKANFDVFLSYYPEHRKALLGLMYCHLKLGNLDQARDILNNKLNKQEDKDSWDGLFQN